MARHAWAQRGGAPETPQELNRYAYARNNPLRSTDPAGHCVGGSVWQDVVSVFDGACVRKGLVILAHARTPDEWALGAFGPPAAAALLTAGMFGFVSPLLADPVTALSTTETSSAGRNGFQRLIYTLDQSGKTIGLTQHAYNAAGEWVHVHDKLDDIATK